MKTTQLIDMLATGAGPAPRALVAKRLVPASALGCLLAFFLAVKVLGPIPLHMFFEPAPWIKISYAASLALACGCLISKLGKPGASGKQAGKFFCGLMAIALLVGFLSYLNTPASQRWSALVGHSWLICPWVILTLSIPVLYSTFWVMKGLAPTHPVKAGAACGLFAGAIGAMAYATACTEMALPFIAIWYTLGIGLSGAMGALLGPFLLKW